MRRTMQEVRSASTMESLIPEKPMSLLKHAEDEYGEGAD